MTMSSTRINPSPQNRQFQLEEALQLDKGRDNSGREEKAIKGGKKSLEAARTTEARTTQ